MQRRFASINSFGLSTRWSDGYTSMPLATEMARLAYCSGCNKIYWLEDATELGVMPSPGEQTQGKSWLGRVFGYKTNNGPKGKIAQVDLLDLDWVDYHKRPRPADLLLAVLREEWSSTEREQYLRTRLWWIGNHGQRGMRIVSPMTDEQTSDNVMRLLSLRQAASNLEQSAETIAELLRQMGRFDEAIAALKGRREGSATAAMIEDAAARRESHVFEVENF